MQDEQIVRCEMWIDLARACQRLTVKQREALALWMEGYTQEEIAERCGVSEQAIYLRLRLVKRTLVVQLA